MLTPKASESEKICICTQIPPKAQTAAMTGKETFPAADAQPLVTSRRHDKVRLAVGFPTAAVITAIAPEKKQTKPQQTSIADDEEETLLTTARENVIFGGFVNFFSAGSSGKKRIKKPIKSDDMQSERRRIFPDSLELSRALPTALTENPIPELMQNSSSLHA